MNLATWSIRNPIPVILLFALLTIAGIWGLHQLSIQDLPDLDLPTVKITLIQPGAAPAQLETEVARKVENSVASVAGLKHLHTSITDGQVQISAEFILEKKLSDALIDTKDAVDRVRSDLPVDLQQPSVTAVTIGDSAMLTYAVASPKMNEEALSWFVDDTLAKALLAVPGVGRFERVGGVQREVHVEIDPTRLASVSVTADDVSRALKLIQQESSGGKTQLGGAEQSVRTVATVAQASELAVLPIDVADGREVRLDQIAFVTDTHAERTEAARLDGKPVVGFRIFRAKGFDETRIAQGVTQALHRLAAAEPSLAITEVAGTVAYTQEQYDGSMHMLLEGAVLAVFVVWWFLRDWRATLIAATALPLSILPTFAVMSWLDFSLNTLTLLALAVIVGVLVDDAIVEIENIERHSQMGKPIVEAAGDAVKEIALAVVATTMTLVVVFVPTALMSGVPGLFFKQFGWTAVVAVLASLLVARLLTPMMAAYLLKAHPPRKSGDGWLMTGYLSWVRWCLSHRKITLSAAVLFLIGSVALIPLIPAGLVPASDRGFTNVSVEMPPGSALADTLDAAELARRAIVGIPGIARVFTTVGGTEPGGALGAQAGEVRKGSLIVTFAARGKRPSQQAMDSKIRPALQDVPGARFAIGAGGPGEKLSLILASDNESALKASAQALERQLRSMGTLSNVRSTASLERPEVIVRPDPQRAAERGVTAAAIGSTVRVATSGDYVAQLAKLNLDNRQIDIRVSMPDDARRNLDSLSNLRVASRDGLVPLSSIATLSVGSGPSQIDRYDRQRYVTVDADLGATPLGLALTRARALPAVQQMPSTVQLIDTGDAEMMGELSSGFGIALIVGMVCVFSVLVLLFRDFFQPITILSALPLSLGGAFLALLVTHSELDVPSMIGLIMLMGIVTKNSILLVEYAIVAIRQRALPINEALIDACHKRARPIVMTTVAMIAGMLPIALGFGADASFRQPMAIAVIGGLLTSTVLSLLIVPVVFVYIDRGEHWLKQIVRHALLISRQIDEIN